MWACPLFEPGVVDRALAYKSSNLGKSSRGIEHQKCTCPLWASYLQNRGNTLQVVMKRSYAKVSAIWCILSKLCSFHSLFGLLFECHGLGQFDDTTFIFTEKRDLRIITASWFVGLGFSVFFFFPFFKNLCFCLRILFSMLL